MKKLFVYFVLFSSLFCGNGKTSSLQQGIQFTQEELKRISNEDPYQRISRLFEKSFNNNDYTKQEWIIKVPISIGKAYAGRPDLQLKAIDAWGKCMRKQTVDGENKYTEQDINLVVNYSKHRLNLK